MVKIDRKAIITDEITKFKYNFFWASSFSFFIFSISSFNFSPSAVYALYFSSSFSLGSLVTAATFATTGTGLLRLYFFSKFLTHG